MKKLLILIPIAVCTFLISCSTYSDEEFYGGRIVGREELEALYSKAVAEDTDRYPVQTDESGAYIFFWTKNGSARHKSRNCQSLSSSSEIYSGTETEAIAAGKEKVCSICK